MDSNELSRLLWQIHQVYARVNELKYQIQFAKHMLRLKTESLKQASDVVAERQASRQKFATIAVELESEANYVAEGLERRREQLDIAKSPREYDSLKLQIELDEAKSDRLTEEAIVALSHLEESEAALEEAQKIWRGCQTAWEMASNDCKTIEADALQKIQESLKSAGVLSERLPRDHASIVTRLVKDGNEPMAPIVDGVCCGYCQEGLPPDVVLKVREGKALCCLSCGKLLFIPAGDVS